MLKPALSFLAVLVALTAATAAAQTPLAPAAPPATPPPAAAPPAAPAPSAEPPPALPPATAPAPLAEPAPTATLYAEPAPVEPPPAPAAEPAPAPEEPPLPKKVSVGESEGVFQPGVLLQGWFLVDRADETSATFRLRRAELSAKGDIVPKLVGYGLMADFAKVLEFGDKSVAVTDATNGETVTVKQPVSAVSALQDFFVTFKSDYVDASLGQYKIPVSYEGSVNSSSKLLFAERAPVSREYGDRRDIGIKLTKGFKYVGYTAGIFNGAGQNNLDNNTGKEAGLRLELYPVEGLLIGGVAYATIGQRKENGAKDRFEGDLRFEKDAFLFQGEFIAARDIIGGKKVNGKGFSAALAYAFLDQTLQPVIRVGYLDPDGSQNIKPMTATAKDELLHVDVGLNYYIQKNEAKVLLNYLRYQYDDRKPNNEVVLSTQVAF